MNRLTTENSVCVAVDLQERLVPAVFENEKMMKNAETLLKGLEIFKVPVLFTEQYPRGLGHTLPQAKDCCPEALVIEKTQFSAVLPELRERLKSLGRKNVILLGTETHVCVFQTAFDLLEEGYEVFLVGDAVGSRTKDNIENGKALMQQKGAWITNTETVLFQFLKDAKSENFKVISNLVK